MENKRAGSVCKQYSSIKINCKLHFYRLSGNKNDRKNIFLKTLFKVEIWRRLNQTQVYKYTGTH